jgi:hypothetical protein
MITRLGRVVGGTTAGEWRRKQRGTPAAAAQPVTAPPAKNGVQREVVRTVFPR